MNKKVLISIMVATFMILPLGGCSANLKPEKYFTEQEIATATAASENETAKGTVIALGGGFDQGDRFNIIRDLSVQYSGKTNPKVLFMPCGHKDELEEREEIIDAYHELGLDVDVLLVSKSTTEECAQKISAADIIYETGGNLKFLTENWAAKGVNQMMHEAFKRGAVLLGVSTGAMCWADRGWDNAEEPTFRITDSFPFFGKESAYAYYNASGILNFSLCPHYDNIAWRIYDKKARKADAPSLCIENGVAVVFRNGKYETVLDKKTRKVYLYYPAKGIKKVDVTKDTTLLTITHYLQEQ